MSYLKRHISRSHSHPSSMPSRSPGAPARRLPRQFVPCLPVQTRRAGRLPYFPRLRHHGHRFYYLSILNCRCFHRNKKSTSRWRSAHAAFACFARQALGVVAYSPVCDLKGALYSFSWNSTKRQISLEVRSLPRISEISRSSPSSCARFAR